MPRRQTPAPYAVAYGHARRPVASTPAPTRHYHAERELRAFVLWRKRSFGTQSERGNLFAERIMTVAHTARKQNRDVLTFLSECVRAQAADAQMPSLLELSGAQAAA